MFGGIPSAGRLLTESDARGPAPVAVLTHTFWMSRFGGDVAVIGRTIELDGRDYEVVGIVDPRFSPPRRTTRQTVAVWVPLDVTRADLQLRYRYVLGVVGRLREGTRIETAGAEIDATMQVMAQEYPEEYVHSDGSIRQVPLVPLHDAEVGSVKGPLLMLLGAVGLMLLIACANVANLFLARGTDREREVAVRTALGASRRRIGAQLLTESVLLSLVGGAIGIALAFLGVDAFTSFGHSSVPRLDQIGIDYRVLTFSVVASVATGVVFGIAPAFYAARTDVNRALKDATSKTSASRGHLRLKGVLVVAEIALALVLLVGAGLLFNSFVRLARVDPGFVPDRVMAVPLALEHGYDTEEARLQFTHEALARVRGIPGISAAAIGLTAPFAESGRCCWMTQAKSAAGDDSLRVVIHAVTPQYFTTLGVRLIQGRDFTPSDDDTEPPPIVVTEALAERLFDEKGVVGRTFTLGRTNPTPFTVVGVVNDLKFWSLSQDEDVDVFVPFEGFGAQFPFFNVVVRAPGDVQGLPNQIRQAVWSVDDRLPVPEILSLIQRVSQSITEPRLLSTLLLAFAGFAILLAAGGIYGTMLYAVSQRSHELGIRLALGASASQLLRHVLRSGATLAAAGLAIGLAGAFVLSRVLSSLVFGITAQDAPTYVAVTALLAGVALLACYLPARKAARLDPMVTLRE
jgi:putative ABC transport system permease protein